MAAERGEMFVYHQRVTAQKMSLEWTQLAQSHFNIYIQKNALVEHGLTKLITMPKLSKTC